ncbi:MAG: glutathione S-transferase [Betaproteobacteria bacterium]|nr:glutathione S-transferase [Betaproteobacteria bacterium]
MKIFFSPASPYVRKCMVTAHELGVIDRIERLGSAANPVNRDANIVKANPLGQVPTFFCDDGTALFDSIVICEYLDATFGGRLFPAAGAKRWLRLREHAVADGILGAALLARYEATMRPEALRWGDWTNGQLAKVRSGVQWLEGAVGTFGDRVDIGTLSVGCALGYLDFRFADLEWRAAAPGVAAWYAAFSRRPSMLATVPHAP